MFPNLVTTADDIAVQRISSRPRILLVDDGEEVRDAIKQYLERHGVDICGEAANGVEAIEWARKLRPDLIVLDLAMPVMNGVEAASILSSIMPGVPIIVLTMYEDLFKTILKSAAGVKAVASKAEGLDKLVESIRVLLPSPSR